MKPRKHQGRITLRRQLFLHVFYPEEFLRTHLESMCEDLSDLESEGALQARDLIDLALNGLKIRIKHIARRMRPYHHALLTATVAFPLFAAFSAISFLFLPINLLPWILDFPFQDSLLMRAAIVLSLVSSILLIASERSPKNFLCLCINAPVTLFWTVLLF